MFYKPLALFGGIALLSGGALASQAQTAQFAGIYTGTLTLDPVTNIVTIAGTGTSTPFNFTTLSGTYSLFPNVTVTDGQGILSDGAGNSLISTFDADEDFIDPIHGTLSQVFTIAGGTGLFAGVTGFAVGTGTFAVTGPTTATFTETLQSVPEPGSLALLTSIGMVSLFGLRRRIL
jgi:hypothetical protein